MIPGLATSDTWDLDSHCHLALFPCISRKNPAPLWPGLISKYCMPPASFQSLPRAEWLSHLELCSISSCCTRSVWTSLRTVPHLEPYSCLRYPGASSQMARSTHMWAALVIQECRYVAPMGMTEWLQDDSHLSVTLQPPHDKKNLYLPFILYCIFYFFYHAAPMVLFCSFLLASCLDSASVGKVNPSPQIWTTMRHGRFFSSLSISRIVSTVFPCPVASTLVLCLLLLTVSWMKYLFHSPFYEMYLKSLAKAA